MNAGERAVAAARAVLGVPFRLHGRDPATGLDCVGLAALALEAARRVPTGYGLRFSDEREIAMRLQAAGLVAVDDVRCGDLLLLRPGPGQLHFAIQSGGGMIHADAGLRRVVERPELPWPVIGRWRREGD
jgi:cell wall-associated NlpC family hydrolase